MLTLMVRYIILRLDWDGDGGEAVNYWSLVHSCAAYS